MMLRGCRRVAERLVAYEWQRTTLQLTRAAGTTRMDTHSREGVFTGSHRGAASRGFTSIPIVDVAALRNPQSTKAEREHVGSELDRACREVGFFYVKNHAVNEELNLRVRELSRQWFDLPADVKAQIALSDCRKKGFRGYQALGANVTRYEGGFQRDWHEAIDLYKHFDSSHPAVAAGLPLHGPNPWPTQVPGYQETLEEYVSECTSLGAALLRGIALGLKLPEDYFAGSRAGDPFWVIRIIHYPPLESAAQSEAHPENIPVKDSLAAQSEARPENIPGKDSLAAQSEARPENIPGKDSLGALAEVAKSVQLSCGEHTDYGLLTIVNQDDHVSALQVKNASGKWVSADPIPGTLVCNVGDMFKVWTNGLYQPTVHRVVNLSRSQRRISVPFFYEPNFDAQVEPLPHLIGPKGTPPKYEAVVYGDHLQKKVFSNFEL